jgi:hypothetical protein
MKKKQTKIERPRVEWLPGVIALAATAAGSSAATVQITLSGNKISSSGNNLNADLSGDMVADVTFDHIQWLAFNDVVVMNMNGGFFSAYAFDGRYRIAAGLPRGTVGTHVVYASNTITCAYYIPISFTDGRINDGIETEAWVELLAFNESSTSQVIQLTRLIFEEGSPARTAFNDIPGRLPIWQVSAVPEPSGFFATSLLLGAAGLIRRRQARAA